MWDPGKSFFSQTIFYVVVILSFLILFSLPKSVGKVPVAKCVSTEPASVPHKYYQAGDLIVGGVISQSFVISEMMSFRCHPSKDGLIEHMWGTRYFKASTYIFLRFLFIFCARHSTVYDFGRMWRTKYFLKKLCTIASFFFFRKVLLSVQCRLMVLVCLTV